MPSLAVRVHKMLGILAVLLAAVVGLQLHAGQSLSTVSVTAHHGPSDDSGWGA
ncbi:hypothetical protein [Kitasatospora sp. NPDC001547]|uniref:hypothetical protein n=1 Tax=Kitasatospora sp. NPDC001547 TaxID=3364015 RepID=UPI0036BB077C|nr:hypothetical protein KitaXyl93_55850 [Kitasatospora sp. Xyl93]